jgi:rRNA processing protein Krr1/Pno1
MAFLNFKKHKKNIEVGVFYNKNSKASYTNVIDKDPNRLAQVLIDLIVQGFPVEKAIKIFQKRLRQKDWMGV